MPLARFPWDTRIAGALVLALTIPTLTVAAQRLDLTTTEKTDLAPGTTVQIEHSTGELNIEGWDEPSIQIEVTRYAWSKTDLKQIQVTKKLEGNVLTIDTTHKRFTGAHVNYRIRLPRNTKLMIHHGIGDVTIYDVSGDIEATTKAGDLIVGLPEPAKYAISAHTKIGSVYSDFEASDPEGRHISLHARIGGITLLKEIKATS